VTERAGVGGSGWSTSAAWVDLDGDGRLDLVVLRYLQWTLTIPGAVSVEKATVRIAIRMRTERLRHWCITTMAMATSLKSLTKLGLAEPGKGLGIALADYDRDGHLDIFVANDSMPEFFTTTKAMAHTRKLR